MVSEHGQESEKSSSFQFEWASANRSEFLTAIARENDPLKSVDKEMEAITGAWIDTQDLGDLPMDQKVYTCNLFAGYEIA